MGRLLTCEGTTFIVETGVFGYKLCYLIEAFQTELAPPGIGPDFSPHQICYC